VETAIQGQLHSFYADIVVVACGAINSAALLLCSANDKHPNGLANTDQVGRNLMKHQNGAIVGVTEIEPQRFPKTLAINDFYWGEPVLIILWDICSYLEKSTKT